MDSLFNPYSDRTFESSVEDALIFICLSFSLIFFLFLEFVSIYLIFFVCLKIENFIILPFYLTKCLNFLLGGLETFCSLFLPGIALNPAHWNLIFIISIVRI